MNLLLDTHVALWAISDSKRLAKPTRSLLMAPQNSLWVSAVSVWEIAIKHALGRGDMPVSAQDALAFFREAGYGLLAVSADHAAAVAALPPHHQDPFDRLLVAQAHLEPMHLLTADAKLLAYGGTVMAA